MVGLGGGVGYGAASGVYGKDLPTKAYPQGTSRRKDAARGVDGGPEHADRNADRPRTTSYGETTHTYTQQLGGDDATEPAHGYVMGTRRTRDGGPLVSYEPVSLTSQRAATRKELARTTDDTTLRPLSVARCH